MKRNHPSTLRRIKRLVLFFFLSLCVVSNSFSQLVENDNVKTEDVYRVAKKDGTIYIGTLIQDDGREILLVTDELGKIYIPKSSVESMRKIDPAESIAPGQYRDAGPFTTRYYFTNNALPIKKGEHYAMLHLYGPEVHFAVSNRFSIGVMATWIAAPLGIALKYSIPTENEELNFSIGTILASSSYIQSAQYFGGLHWGSMTLGKPGKNMTFSAGFSYTNVPSNSAYSPDFRKAPVASIAGIAPVGKKASFIFDSMVFFGEHSTYRYGNQIPSELMRGAKVTTIFMPAMRFQQSERVAFQVALAGVIQYREIEYSGVFRNGNTRSFPVPMCSWFFKF